MPTALLVIDMINDFADTKGALYSAPVGAIVPAVKRECDAAAAAGWPAIFTVDAHIPNDPEFAMFPPHGLEGWGREIVAALRDVRRAGTIEKSRFSSFYATDLDGRLRALGVDRLRVVGNCTNICVFFTVADARNRLYEVEVVRDAVASFDPTAHEYALRQMNEVLGASLV